MRIQCVEKHKRFGQMKSKRLFGQYKKYLNLQCVIFDDIFELWVRIEDTRWKAVCRKHPFLRTSEEI